MIATHQLTVRRLDQDAEVQTAKEAMQEDQDLISGEGIAKSTSSKSANGNQATVIKLADLLAALKQAQATKNSTGQSTSLQTLTVDYRKVEW